MSKTNEEQKQRKNYKPYYPSSESEPEISMKDIQPVIEDLVDEPTIEFPI